MDLSIPYVKRDLAVNHNANEFQIVYDEKSTLNDLSFFATFYSDKIINVLFSEKLDMTKCADLILNSGCKNIVAVFPSIPTRDEANYFVKSGVKFYSLIPANDYYLLDYLLSIGVDSIFIIGTLWHELPIVKSKLKDVKLRMHGDMSGTTFEYPESVEEYYTVFIPRPEDYDLLDEYVDVIQFNTVQPNELSVLYKLWFVTKKWLGNVREILFFDRKNGLDFPNNLMQNNYTEMKIKCGARCLTGESKCRVCRHMVELAKLIEEKGEQFNDG